MSLQFVMGNSGSGKSYYLYSEIVKQSIEHPEKNYIILVPEQFTMQTQKDLCEAHPRGGIMNIDVLSFDRLAQRIFDEVGCKRKTVLGDEGKSLVLRKVSGKCEDELKVLRGNLNKVGYISELKSVISEFTQYGIHPQKLQSIVEELDEDSYLKYKLKDICKVYELFEDFLSEKYITKEELLELLIDVVPQSSILKDSVIAMDGFTGFTPVQNCLIGELLSVCEKVMITVEADQREQMFVYQHPYQLFSLSKQMISSLLKIAEEKRIEVEDAVDLCTTPAYRFKDNKEMAFLESELFRNHRQRFQQEQNSIHLYEVRNPMQEAEFVAEKIRSLVRTKGYRYREIAVICSDMDVYADAMEKACESYEVPIFMDHKKSILLNSFVEYVRSLLAMIEANFDYESVFRHLRTGFWSLSSKSVDELENYCLATGIKKYKQWQQPWTETTRETNEKRLERLNHLRVIFVEKTKEIRAVLKQRKKTVKDITQALYEYIKHEKVEMKLNKMAEMFQTQKDFALAKEYEQIYRIMMDIFDKFVELLGDEQISLKEYCELFDVALEEGRVGVIPPSLDQVVIGDVKRTRIKNIRALFFVGANDTLLPGGETARGILSERDREHFQEFDVVLSPGAKEKMYIQKFYLYMNLTKPTDQLYISWARVSSAGKSIRPAYVVKEIRKLFPDLELQHVNYTDFHNREFTRKTGIATVVDGLRNRQYGLTEQWKELYSWFYRDEDSHEEVKQILDASFMKKEENKISPEEALSLYPEKEKISVTRMEQYASCAYAHFLSYGLRLSERQEYRFEPLDLGNIVHQSLELYGKKVKEMDTEWKDITEEKRAQMVEQCVEASVKDYNSNVLYSSARNKYLIYRMTCMISKTVWALTKQLEQGDFLPTGQEVSFTGGKIDRIDTYTENERVYVKVIDYKTGAKQFDITALYYGLQMQLPIYLNAALEMEKEKNGDREVIPAGVFYYKVQDPIVEKGKNDQDTEKNVLKELRLDGLMNGEEHVLGHLEKNLSGTSVYYPIGYTKSGSLRSGSQVLSEDDFNTVLEYTKLKERELKEKIFEGNVDVSPYEMGEATGCDYCAYRDICRFDPTIEGYKYRRLTSMPMEITVGLMKEEVKKNEEKSNSVEEEK